MNWVIIATKKSQGMPQARVSCRCARDFTSISRAWTQACVTKHHCGEGIFILNAELLLQKPPSSDHPHPSAVRSDNEAPRGELLSRNSARVEFNRDATNGRASTQWECQSVPDGGVRGVRLQDPDHVCLTQERYCRIESGLPLPHSRHTCTGRADGLHLGTTCQDRWRRNDEDYD